MRIGDVNYSTQPCHLYAGLEKVLFGNRREKDFFASWTILRYFHKSTDPLKRLQLPLQFL